MSFKIILMQGDEKCLKNQYFQLSKMNEFYQFWYPENLAFILIFFKLDVGLFCQNFDLIKLLEKVSYFKNLFQYEFKNMYVNFYNLIMIYQYLFEQTLS